MNQSINLITPHGKLIVEWESREMIDLGGPDTEQYIPRSPRPPYATLDGDPISIAHARYILEEMRHHAQGS